MSLQAQPIRASCTPLLLVSVPPTYMYMEEGESDTVAINFVVWSVECKVTVLWHFTSG